MLDPPWNEDPPRLSHPGRSSGRRPAGRLYGKQVVLHWHKEVSIVIVSEWCKANVPELGDCHPQDKHKFECVVESWRHQLFDLGYQ